MYAVVDIETTGSPVKNNGITEIAIILYDGKEIEGRYETLINPKFPIPKYVAKLTGISDDMVATAPYFEDVAEHIFNLLKGRIFVAHNVGFDFPYVQHFLRTSGYNFTAPVLCTLNLSRKTFPNFEKHGLSTVCEELKIEMQNHHRAGGDAMATAILLDIIIKNGGGKLVKSMIAK
jgi:DNA polymerase-3 subunit epsilon